MQKELEQTRGNFKLRGIVVGLDNGYAEGEKDGYKWKRLQFGVKTSPINTVYVEVGGSESNKVKAKNGKDSPVVEFDFHERHNLPEGYYLSGRLVSAVITKDENNKNLRKSNIGYDAVDYILKHLKNGDSVYVTGEPNYRTYNEKLQVSYPIGYISKNDPIDFESPDFKEMCAFEQTIVVTGNTLDKDKNKLYVNANIIKYNKDWSPAVFAIDASGEYKDFANNIYKTLKYGDEIAVSGRVLNGVVTQQVEVQQSSMWGKKPTGYDTITDRVSEMRIEFADGETYEKQGKRKYKQEDFVRKQVSQNESNSNALPDVSDDDLPF